MPTLSNIDGRSLVPDVSGVSQLLLQTFGTKQSRDKEAAQQAKQAEFQKQIDILAGVDSQLPPGTIDESGAIGRGPTLKQKEAALIRLSALNPQAANAIRQTMERGDKVEAQQIAAETDKGTRLAISIQKQPDFVSKQRAITQAAQEAASQGKDVSRFLDLANMSEEQLDLELQKMIIQGADLKTLTDDALNPAGDEGFTLSPGQKRFGASGEVVASVEPKAEAKTTLIRNMESAGIDPNSAEGRNIIKKSLTKSGVTVKVGGDAPFKIPPGFMLLDKNNVNAGVTPIPGGPKDSLTAESAAKTQMLKTAKSAFPGVKKLVFDKDGSLNRTNLFTADQNVPFTEGRKLRNKMEQGIQAITRSETGAAMPPEEVENTRKRFMPQVGDTKEIAETKLRLYEEFIEGTIKLIDPTGTFDDDGFERELESRTALPPDGEDAAVFTGNKTPEGFQIFQRPDGSTFAVSP